MIISCEQLLNLGGIRVVFSKYEIASFLIHEKLLGIKILDYHIVYGEPPIKSECYITYGLYYFCKS